MTDYKGSGTKRSCPDRTAIPGGTEEILQSHHTGCRCPGQHSNRASPEYKSAELSQMFQEDEMDRVCSTIGGEEDCI
jgi:hypothetical protein